MTKVFIASALGLSLIGCGDLPTAPTQAQAVDLFLRWELTAPGCQPTRPTPTVSGQPTLKKAVLADGTTLLFAEWPTTPKLGAVFVSMGAFYGVCGWGYERGESE